MDMDGSEVDDRRRVGSVKAAVNFYGDRIADISSPSLKKTQMDFSVKPSSKAKEPHRARKDIGRYKESRGAAESAEVEAESELSNAKKTVMDLSPMIEESSSKAKALVVRRNEIYEYAQVMRELEFVKQELYKLKLDVAAVLEEKSRAEEQMQSSRSKMLSCSETGEVLCKEIEEANEDHVLVELARIEALKDLGDLEAQREKEENEFLSKMESTRKKLKEAIDEIDESREIEMKLAVTMSDVDLLQNELNLVREMQKGVQRDENIKHSEESFGVGDESADTSMLQTITEELEAAQKELASIKEEGFQFMASIDVIRNELKHVTAETDRLKKEEMQVDSIVQILSSKLLRAKSKLEAVSAAEEKAKSIVISLSHTLDELKAETEAAKKEEELISQEVTTTKAEIQKTELEIDLNEERLQGAMQELEAIKESEIEALEKLKTLTESTMRERALAAQHSSLITISKFEYEYLIDHAAGAEEIADKKVAAAHAWIEALKASEKEILVRTKVAQREIKETSRLEEQLEVTKGKQLSMRDSLEELENWPRKRGKNSGNNLQRAVSRKSINSNDTMIAAKRKSSSSAARHMSSFTRKSINFNDTMIAAKRKSSSSAARRMSPFTIKKRKKVIPNLASFFRGKRNIRISLIRERKKEKQ